MFKRAIIADDSMLSRMVLAKHLKLLFAGIEIEQAPNGVEALNLFKAWDNIEDRIIFLDFMMPEMNGLEALDAIRKISPDILIYIITANVQDKTRNDAMQLGATGFINKTMKIDELREIFKDKL